MPTHTRFSSVSSIEGVGFALSEGLALGITHGDDGALAKADEGVGLVEDRAAMVEQLKGGLGTSTEVGQHVHKGHTMILEEQPKAVLEKAWEAE